MDGEHVAKEISMREATNKDKEDDRESIDETEGLTEEGDKKEDDGSVALSVDEKESQSSSIKAHLSGLFGYRRLHVMVINIIIYYISTNEIPSDLLRENMISSHVKSSLLPWLHVKIASFSAFHEMI